MKKENILILFIFGLLITGMALDKQLPTKQAVSISFEKSNAKPFEPIKDSCGAIQITMIKTFSIDEKRQVFINKLIKI